MAQQFDVRKAERAASEGQVTVTVTVDRKAGLRFGVRFWVFAINLLTE
jgi:hypothetical protein